METLVNLVDSRPCDDYYDAAYAAIANAYTGIVWGVVPDFSGIAKDKMRDGEMTIINDEFKSEMKDPELGFIDDEIHARIIEEVGSYITDQFLKTHQYTVTECALISALAGSIISGKEGKDIYIAKPVFK